MVAVLCRAELDLRMLALERSAGLVLELGEQVLPLVFGLTSSFEM